MICQQRSITSATVILNIIKIKLPVLANLIIGLFGQFYFRYITVSPFKLLFAIYCIDCLYHLFLKPSLWGLVIAVGGFLFTG